MWDYSHILEIYLYSIYIKLCPCHVRTLKLSNIEPDQYLDGWPLGNAKCYKLGWAVSEMDNSLEW